MIYWHLKNRGHTMDDQLWQEPSTFTCEARRYGKFECPNCDNAWGSAFGCGSKEKIPILDK